jgi:acetoacetyl-CoA reductase/3-oxoacyl-[acyl-carrier protein] reductase
MDACREVVPLMRERRWGRIVNIASDSAFIGSKSAAAYAAAKAGVLGFTRSLARELAEFGITANAVAPGYIRTRAMDQLPQTFVDKAIAETPLRRLGSPEDIAHAVAFFASDQAGFVTGQTLIVNGGRWMN